MLILFEKWSNKLMEILRLFGRVPFFFYVLHIPLIHFASMLYFKIVHGEWLDIYQTSVKKWPEYYEPSLLRIYVAWILLTVILYYACRWYNDFKKTHDHWWLKYL